MGDLNGLAANLRERHEYVSIGAPKVSRWQGVFPRYCVDWTEEITDSAYNFANRFIVLLPAVAQ